MLYLYETMMRIGLLFYIGLASVALSFLPFDWEGKSQAHPSIVKVQKMYPNPANAYIIFEVDPSIVNTHTLFICSFMGKKTHDMLIQQNKITVDLQQQQRGLYIYQIRDKYNRIVESGKFNVIK
ncbi:MAG: T9SS type A sorting domain-containing protein [Hydrotalea sp.]|nr:T9SS type A sorting domain-containing protein [Hydrotalea sp.]